MDRKTERERWMALRSKTDRLVRELASLTETATAISEDVDALKPCPISVTEHLTRQGLYETDLRVQSTPGTDIDTAGLVNKGA